MQALNILAQLLANNVGNTLTPELATGIVTRFNQEVMKAEAASVASMASSQNETGTSTP